MSVFDNLKQQHALDTTKVSPTSVKWKILKQASRRHKLLRVYNNTIYILIFTNTIKQVIYYLL